MLARPSLWSLTLRIRRPAALDGARITLPSYSRPTEP
jgi:hypothetical protein